MKKICAWCSKDLGEVPPKENQSVTHGICPECAAKMRQQIEKRKDEKKQ